MNQSRLLSRQSTAPSFHPYSRDRQRSRFPSTIFIACHDTEMRGGLHRGSPRCENRGGQSAPRSKPRRPAGAPEPRVAPHCVIGRSRSESVRSPSRSCARGDIRTARLPWRRRFRHTAAIQMFTSDRRTARSRVFHKPCVASACHLLIASDGAAPRRLEDGLLILS